MKKQEIKKLSKDEMIKNIDKLKKIYLILDFKRSIRRLQIQLKLEKQEKL
jgi:ribosomal protein L29